MNKWLSWGIYAEFDLIIGALCVTAAHEHDWFGVGFSGAIFAMGAVACWKTFPKCRHEHERCVGTEGDERIVAETVTGTPDTPIRNVYTAETRKLKCLECGRVRLYFPSPREIREKIERIEGRKCR